MTAKQHPIVVIACKVFQDMLERFLPSDLADQITFLDYGLHEVPKKLTKALQEQIDSIQEPSRILLCWATACVEMDCAAFKPGSIR